MLDLPKWAERWIKLGICSRCRTPYRRRNVFRVGVCTEPGKREPPKFFIHVLCAGCKQHECVTSSASYTVREMVAFYQGEYQAQEERRQRKARQARRRRAKQRRRRSGPITDDEVRQNKEELGKIESHNEFLRKLGIKGDADARDSTSN